MKNIFGYLLMLLPFIVVITYGWIVAPEETKLFLKIMGGFGGGVVCLFVGWSLVDSK